ncbi:MULTISPECIES: hypothetical protein [unclassified Burkholderia]|uniref:hypothetical protein n=1 Tax=unclassified Burkholderia TaxID=2613784 RepID=UPI0015C667D5|nr:MULTISPECIES: hypothetical protein [unclassified Burkholderia]
MTWLPVPRGKYCANVVRPSRLAISTLPRCRSLIDFTIASGGRTRIERAAGDGLARRFSSEDSLHFIGSIVRRMAIAA